MRLLRRLVSRGLRLLSRELERRLMGLLGPLLVWLRRLLRLRWLLGGRLRNGQEIDKPAHLPRIHS